MRRREFVAGALLPPFAAAAQTQASPTRFQIACMTLPYSAFPLERALTGIKQSGFKYVAWGVNHREGPGPPKPVLAVDAPPREAAQLATRGRNMGIEPVMMFATVNLEAPNAVDAHLKRIEQAAAAKIPFLLTFGKTGGGEYDAFLRTLKTVAPRARTAGVTIVIKQHGGNTATGKHCARIVAAVADAGLKICYDAGNVLDYEKQDPIPDIQTCWSEVRAFAIKDHRNTPKSEDCGPGFGEIDHYKLLLPVMRTGLAMPLACENIFEPLTPRPSSADGVDALAVRAREYLESVIRGLTSHLGAKSL